MKKNPIAWPMFLKIVGPAIGFFLSAKNALKMADPAEKCAWQNKQKLQNTPNPKEQPL